MSKLQVDEIVNKEDTGSPTLPKGVVVTGVTTSTTFSGNVTGDVVGNVTGNVTGTATTATNAANAESGSTLETSINAKASTGKAIAMSMVFG